MARYELTDEQWAVVEPLLPRPLRPFGRPPRPARDMLNGMFWILFSGAPWRDLPERYGPWQSVYHRFNAYRKNGTFERILGSLQMQLNEKGLLDWSLWCVDGTSIRASRAAAGAGKKGGLGSQKTMPWDARGEASRARSTSLPTARVSRSRSISPRGSAMSPHTSRR